jgi:tetratricopeptide (TPR) repeat protein
LNSYGNNIYYQQLQTRQYNSHINYPDNYSDNAWETLAQGQAQIALRQFSKEAQAYPKAAVPKIGYALSAAIAGDLKQGVIAMRRAFKIDPESLHYFHIGQGLIPPVSQLISKYQHKLSHRGRRKNEAFMVAALSYLIQDYTTAYQALERAERDGDRSRSFKNLRNILQEIPVAALH